MQDFNQRHFGQLILFEDVQIVQNGVLIHLEMLVMMLTQRYVPKEDWVLIEGHDQILQDFLIHTRCQNYQGLKALKCGVLARVVS